MLPTIALLIATLATAAVDPMAPIDPTTRCIEAATTQLDLNRCARLEYERAQQRLDRLRATVHGGSDAVGRRLLDAAERRFVRYRQAHCDWAADLHRGGTLAPMERTACLTDLTTRRAAELEAFLGLSR